MSKYSILKGLTKLLPSGEKAVIGEGDDIIRALQALDERQIESALSQRDAYSRAYDIKKQIGKKLYPREEMDYAERKPKLAELSRKFHTFNDGKDLIKLFDRIDSPRTVGAYHFPEEFDRYVDPEEIAQLSKQFRDNEEEIGKSITERLGILRELEKNNPEFRFAEQIKDDPVADYNEVSKRFKNIRSSLRDVERKKK